MGRYIGLQVAGHVVDIGGRFVGQTDEDQSGDAPHMDLLQPVAGGVESRPHMLGVQQRAVQAVGPLVIAADDIADRRLFVMDQPRAAMAADVVEGPKPHVVVAGDDDGGAVDIDHHAVARLRHVGLDADIDPVPPEDDVEVGLEDFRAGVEGLLQL